MRIQPRVFALFGLIGVLAAYWAYVGWLQKGDSAPTPFYRYPHTSVSALLTNSIALFLSIACVWQLGVWFLRGGAWAGPWIVSDFITINNEEFYWFGPLSSSRKLTIEVRVENSCKPETGKRFSPRRWEGITVALGTRSNMETGHLTLIQLQRLQAESPKEPWKSALVTLSGDSVDTSINAYYVGIKAERLMPNGEIFRLCVRPIAGLRTKGVSADLGGAGIMRDSHEWHVINR